MRNEPIDPRDLIDPACDRHFRNWAEWMQGYEVGIGYSHRSAGIENRTSDTFDDMCRRMDRDHAKTMNAIIYGLPRVKSLVIEAVYLSPDVWTYRRVEFFIDTAAEVWKLAQKRGLS